MAAVLHAGSEKAAAQRLGLSHSTVKHHLANARSKVAAETTAQLVWISARGCRSRLPPAPAQASTAILGDPGGGPDTRHCKVNRHLSSCCATWDRG